jgi:hypothetical protein
MDPIFCPHVDRYDHTAVWPNDVPFPAEIINSECRFDFETRGSIMSRLTGIAVEKTENGVKVYGVRSLSRPRESGYRMEGRVSVGGESRRAFTSSQLFLVDGRLVDVGILYVCKEATND